ncbi:unnamed protein product, partial [Discosporangium mesarthrocarpum]
FRRRFRLPFPFYKKLVEECKRERWFGRLGSADTVGHASIPVELKYLTVLKILCRGYCLDNIEMVSGIHEGTVQACFHTFSKNFAKRVYKTWISAPEGEDLKDFTATYARLGFPGALGSCDVTHVRWDKAPASRTVYYTGKEGFPSIAYSATVDHTRRALALTAGFAGATNEKTIVRYDPSVDRVKIHEEYTQMEDTLRESTKKGAYLIVDGGYHQWRCLMCPLKSALAVAELTWSKRLESVKKYVECFFGRLKGRFRILKMPLTFWVSTANSREKIDNIFFACCVLQSMLHAYDG